MGFRDETPVGRRTQAAAVLCWPQCVRAAEQPDVVDAPGEFQNAVETTSPKDNIAAGDVAEMLMAADRLCAAAGDTVDDMFRLRSALMMMDQLQRAAAYLYDKTYDDYLDLYPAWCMYILYEGDDPVRLNDLFANYERLLDQYDRGQKDLLEDLGVLLALQKALVPSNVYADPYERILPSVDITDVLSNFDTDKLNAAADDDDDDGYYYTAAMH